jgi:hypothetical protein
MENDMKEDIDNIIAIIRNCYNDNIISSNSINISELNSTIDNINDFIPWSKALRNIIRSKDDTARAFYIQENVGIIYIASICKSIALNRFNSNNDDNDNNYNDNNNDLVASFSTITLHLCQFIANFTACSDDQKQYFWHSNSNENILMIEVLRDMMAAAVNTKNRAALACVTAALYNSINYNNCDIDCTICCHNARYYYHYQ